MIAAILSIVAGIAAATLIAALALVMATRRVAREAETAVPASGRFVEVDGNRIHYVERGEGPAILLIHGLGGTLHHLRRPLMEEFGDGYRLVAIDRPGSGYSTRGKGDDGRLSMQARQTAALIDALGLGRPLIVGHSLGGAVALATALDFPDKVAGLALIAPLTQVEKQTPAEFRALAIRRPWLRRLASRTIAIPMSVRNAQRTLAFVFGPQEPPADYAVAGGALAGLRPGHFYATSSDLVALGRDQGGYVRRYGELQVPVGILFGTQDRVLDHTRHGREMVGVIPGLDLELLDGIGHMPQYAETARVVAFIRRLAARAFARPVVEPTDS